MNPLQQAHTPPARDSVARDGATRAPRLEVRGLGVELGGVDVLSGVSLAVDAGRWLTVLGPNGAGKSTFLRAVAGVVAARGGVWSDGEELHRLGRRARARRVALVPQEPTFPPSMTVDSYALLGRTAHLGILGRERRGDLAVVEGVLVRLGLRDLADRPVAALSGGERQRVAIARALVQDASLLLLDEPTSSLDVGHQLEVLELVDELRRERGLTVVAAMHDLTLAAQFADEVALLESGRLVMAGTPEEVLTERTLSRYYRANVRVVRDGDLLLVVPDRRAGPTS